MSSDISPQDLLEADGIEELGSELEAESSDQKGIWRTEVYRLLNSDYRRKLLEEIINSDKDQMDKRELAKSIVAEKNGKETYELHSSEIKGGMQAFKEIIPDLEEHDIIETSALYEVRKADNFSIVEDIVKSEETDGGLFEILKNDRRNMVVQLMARYESETVPKNQLALDIAAVENRKPPGNITEKEKKTVYNNLHQNHLVKLQDENIIRWERDTNLVEKGQNYDLAREYAGLDRIYRDGS